MFTRYFVQSRPETISHTLITALVLLALFNSTVWAPALEPRPTNNAVPDSQALPSKATTADHSPGIGALARSSSINPSLRPASTVVGSGSGAIHAANSSVAIDPTIKTGVPSGTKSPDQTVQSNLAKQLAFTSVNAGTRFIENKGQFDSNVKFQVRSGGKTLWLTSTGIVFDNIRTMTDTSSTQPPPGLPGVQGAPTPPGVERLVFAEDLVGANANVTIEPLDPQSGVYNYMQTSDSSKWHTGVRAYGGVIYHGIWDGIDLHLFARGGDIEQEFLIHPGADLANIQVEYRGIEELEVAADGSLVVQTKFGDLRESTPQLYQEIAGKRTALNGRFELTSSSSYRFQVDGYDTEYALLIDPTLLYSSYLGGHGNDTASAVAVDSSGAAYITGLTESSDFPVTPGAFSGPTWYYNAFLTKVSPLGDKMVFSTLLGPGGGNGIAVDVHGNIYVLGLTDSGTVRFPTTTSAFSACSGQMNFLAKLISSGNSLLYSSCIGNATTTYWVGASGLAVDNNGKAYITGTSVTYIPTTNNAYQTNGKGGYPFLSVLDTNASGSASLYYSTYFGGSDKGDYGGGVGQARAIAIDTFGKAYITGWTYGFGFPTTAGTFQTTYYGAYHCHTSPTRHPSDNCHSAFVAKFDPSSATGPQSLIYSTLLGGGHEVDSDSIAVDNLGNAYVVSCQDCYWSGNGPVPFPTTPGSFLPDGLLYSATYVTKLNAGGSKLLYSTGLAGGQAVSAAIAVDNLGNAYVSGSTNKSNFPVTLDAAQSHIAGDWDGFITKLNSDGSGLVYSTYLGGGGHDQVQGITVDSVGDAYAVGLTKSFNFPVTPYSFQPGIGGPEGCEYHLPCDAFVTKFPTGSTFRVLQVLPASGGNAGNLTLTIFGGGFHAGLLVKLSGGGPDIVATPVTIAPNGLSVMATFNLQGAATGLRDIVVTNPDGTSITLPQAFTVIAGGAVNLQMSKVATKAVPGRSTTWVITVTNTGTIDSGTLPIVEPLGPWIKFADSNPVPSAIRQAPKAFPPGSTGSYNAFIEWDIPNIPAGQSVSIRYTAALDPSYPVGQTLSGHSCIDFAHAVCERFSVICWGRTVLECIIATPLGCLGFCAECMLEDRACELAGGAICYDLDLITASSLDPNSLTGLPGVGVSRWISGQVSTSFMISFANESTATVPAQQVIVTDPLSTNLDMSTLALTSINIPGVDVPIPPTFVPVAGQNEVTTNVDLRPAQNLLVNIDAKLDPQSRLMTWTFKSIDPITGQPPTDSSVGFLPPGAGGSVSFTVKPKNGLATGTQVADQATVVFDANAPMNTPIWINTLDNNAPVSRVAALPATESCSNFKVQWSGSDIGVGTQSYTVYASDTGAAFAPWLTNTSSTSSVYPGQVGHVYRFYSVVRDLVGNVEPAKTSAEASTQVTSASSCGPPSLSGAASVASYINTTLSLNLQFTNIGTSDALNALVKTLTFRTLTGTGGVTLSSPQLPLIFGSISVDGAITLPLTLNVPATVKKFSMTEGGTMQDGSGKTYNFSIGQNVVP